MPDTISCDPNELMQAAACFNKCIPQGAQGGVDIYLLQQLAGNTMTPDQLLEQAKCLNKCIPPGEAPGVIIYLLCQILNSDLPV